MRPATRRWHTVRSAAAAFLVAACGVVACGVVACAVPAPSPAPEPTTRPDLPAVAPWPDLTWGGSEFRLVPGVVARRFVAVAAGRSGVVAVGHEDLGASANALVAHAADGRAFKLVGDPAFAGFGLDDVVAVDEGFVAIGSQLGEPFEARRSKTVLLRSADGRSWQRLPDEPILDGAYGGTIAAGPGGVLVAAGWTDGSDQRLWRSPDGTTWATVRAADIGLAGVSISSIEGSRAGWLVSGSLAGDPVVADSRDGKAWRVRPLVPSGRPDRLEPYVERAVAGRWGWLATGHEPHDCNFLWFEGDCAAYPIAWWSDGAGDWRVLPERPGAGPGPNHRIVPAGERGLLAVSDSEAWASVDGVAWQPLNGPTGIPALVNDALVIGDAIVAVGEGYTEGGATIGWLSVAAPIHARP